MASFSPLAGRRSRQGGEGRAPSFQTQNRVAMWPRGCSMRSWWLPMAVAGGFRLSADGAGFEASALAPHPHLLPVHGEKGALKPASSSWVVVRSCGGTKDLIQTWSLRPIRVRRSSMASFSPLAGRRSRQGDEGRALSFQTGNPSQKTKGRSRRNGPVFSNSHAVMVRLPEQAVRVSCASAGSLLPVKAIHRDHV